MARQSKLEKRRARALPLDEFPPEHEARILEAVAQPEPPKKYIDLGLASIVSRAWFEWHWQRGIDPEGRTPLPAWLRERVIQRDGLICGLCGTPVEKRDVHIDHIFPRSKGGRDILANLQVAHSRCNMRKGARV